jgi:hypothetical protein
MDLRDFEPARAQRRLSVRLTWRGVTPVNVNAPAKYLCADEVGVSHFRYGRENLPPPWMHPRLVGGFFLRLSLLLPRRSTGRSPLGST